MDRRFPLTLVVFSSLVVAALPVPAAAGHGTSSCSDGLGIGSTSCSFVCHEGERITAGADGLAYVRATCGGAITECAGTFCIREEHATSDGVGTCEVTGYVWFSFHCSAA